MDLGKNMTEMMCSSRPVLPGLSAVSDHGGPGHLGWGLPATASPPHRPPQGSG